jgi:carbonic anhydrase
VARKRRRRIDDPRKLPNDDRIQTTDRSGYPVGSATGGPIGVRDILANNRAWAASRLTQDPDFFSRLSEGQNPSILYIGCSDSRVTAEEMMGLGPGEAFVFRNISNTASRGDVGAAAVIDLAVGELGVDDIVVCGHYLCGGIEAAMRPRREGPLDRWLQTIRDVYHRHAVELDAVADPDARLRRLVELNVVEQCRNVMGFDAVDRARRSGGLGVHGWVFDIAAGRLIDLEIGDSVEPGGASGGKGSPQPSL